MATALLEPAFTTGEVSPSLFGRQDVARFHTAASTMRNMFVSYKGGAYSRPGTRFVGMSIQSFADGFPPRLIPFQFSINQGLILEFGNRYMRVIQDGSFVTENPIPITNITQAVPGVVTTGASGGTSAVPLNANVISSYAPGDIIVLAGGVYTVQAQFQVITTELQSVAVGANGHGYAAGDVITLSGGTGSAAQVTVARTQIESIVVVSAGSGGTPGSAIITGTTGVGSKFQVGVTITAGGSIASIDTVPNQGSYTTNPTNLNNEPVTGGGLTGATVKITMGIQSIFVSPYAGSYTVNPSGGTFTQASTTGLGTGATFQSAVMGVGSVLAVALGTYSVLPTNPVSQDSTTGTGLGVQFNVTWNTPSGNDLNTSDWVYVSGVQGMTELNGQIYIIQVLDPITFALWDMFGNPVDTTVFGAYTGGGTVARIFKLDTIYNAVDLPYLKFVQSADVMTLCCVNWQSGVEYPPQDLERFSDTNWVFTPIVPVPSITPPASTSGSASAPPAANGSAAYYAYVVTSVAKDGTESIASPVAYIDNAVDIAATAGSITITWTPVDGAITYNIYKAEVNYDARPPVGSLFGFAGTSYGAQFVDSNIVADFQQVPPLHRNPFVHGQITDITMDSVGSGYTYANVTVNSLLGSGAILQPIIVNGAIVSIAIIDPGGLYEQFYVDGTGDTVVISGDGVGAAAHITVGPESGTYPSVPAYFQQRRVLASSLNNPDTYWMSQPGAFTNFDTRIPTIDSDAITGTPWTLQVNGIQFFALMPAGLATMTGLSAWLLVGAGSFATNVQPITPASQVAQPLAFTGHSQLLPPIKINYDIIYVTSKGSYYYDLPYQLYALSEPIDLTLFSSHLFDKFVMREHTWAETPFKMIWTIRNDHNLLTLTYLKQQQVAGWARHDTNGGFWSIASCVEPVIAARQIQAFTVGDYLGKSALKHDAVYVVVSRAAP